MSIIDTLLSFIAPFNCLGCGAEGGLACPACQDTALVMPESHFGADNYLYPAFAYAGVTKQLVQKLKYGSAPAAADVMARQLLKVVDMRPSGVLVPVPTTTGRVRQRGYDQAELLAKALSRQSGLPSRRLLARHGQSHQVGASGEQRRKQLQGAYRLTGSIQSHQAVILVDDVFTTGATLEAAAQAFDQAGADIISAITFARALKYPPQ